MDFVLGLPRSKKVETLFLLWLIGFLKWRISLHAIKQMMHLISQTCSSGRLYVCMAFLRVQCQIMMLSSLATFGRPCGESWELNSYFLQHVILKQMDKLR
jgi:hypothetical protein